MKTRLARRQNLSNFVSDLIVSLLYFFQIESDIIKGKGSDPVLFVVVVAVCGDFHGIVQFVVRYEFREGVERAFFLLHVDGNDRILVLKEKFEFGIVFSAPIEQGKAVRDELCRHVVFEEDAGEGVSSRL